MISDALSNVCCSVRDLSLLLEALLKTTSRTVLSDIMNKNGLPLHLPKKALLSLCHNCF